MEEIWKSSIEPYEVSSFGNIRRKLLSGGYKEVKGSVMNRGYRYWQLNRNKKRINILIHQEVARLFISERPEGLVIDHIDRNKLNNHFSNLRYITQKENTFNHDRVHTDIPQDIPQRRSLVMKRNWEKIKDVVNISRREKVHCDKCNRIICRGYLLTHTRKCDGTNARKKCGRKKGDKTCILNLGVKH